MSRTIDERVVSMQFDNKQFESNVQTSLGTIEKLKQSLNLSGAAKGLDNIDRAAKKVDMSMLGNAAHTVGLKFSAMYTMADQALRNITNRVQYTAENMIKAFTIDPVKTGLAEYETQIGAVQTILANTSSKGTTLNDVNGALDELNTYADKTIYNFTEMTRNIGTFTAAGVDLDKSVTSIKGIANLAAVSGSTSQQASTAMYQLSQALAAGKVQLMDWNSVVNAGMGGQVFQDALKRTATQMGTNVDALIKKYGSFRESLTQGNWLTAEVLTETLTQLSGAYSKADLIAQGYSESQAQEIVELSKTAVDAATKVKTFSQLIDTLKEAAQSGWTQTWELLIGDFEEAKSLWTSVSDTVGGFINATSEARNSLLAGALNSNWEKMIGKINDAGVETTVFEKKVKEVLKENGYDVDELVKKYGSLEGAFKSGKVSSDLLKEAVEGISKSASKVDLSSITKKLKKGMKGDDVKKAQEALKALGHDLGKAGIDGIFGKDTEAAVKAFQELQGLEVTGIIDEKTLAALEKASSSAVKLDDSIDGLIDGITELGGREKIIQSFKNIFEGLKSVIKPIKDAFKTVFPPATSEQLVSLIDRFQSFTEKLKLNRTQAIKVFHTFKGLFAAIDIGWTFVKSLAGGIVKLLGNITWLGDGVLGVTGSIGDWISGLRDSIKETDIFGTVIGTIVSVIQTVIDKIRQFASFIRGKFKMPGFEFFFSLMKGIWNIIGKIGSAVGKVASAIGNALAEGFSSGDIGAALDIANGGILAALLLTVKKFFGKLSGSADEGFGLFDKLKEACDGIANVFDTVRGALETWQQNLKATILLKIAAAVGILAAAIWVISGIDGGKLAAALTAITVLFADLMGAMAIFSKISGGMTGTFKAISIMIGISTAVLILAFALRTVASLSWKELAVGLVGILGLVGIVVGAVKILGKEEKTVIEGAASMVVFAFAIKTLVSACKDISSLSWEELGKGLLGVGALIAGISLFLKKSKFDNKGIMSTSIGIVVLATAMKIFASACKSFGQLGVDELIKGLVSIGLLLSALSTFTKKAGDGTGMIKNSVALIMIGASMKIFASVVKDFGSMNVNQLAIGLIGMGTALAAVAIAMKYMPADMLSIGAGLGIVAVSLMIVVKAIKEMGGMSWSELLTGVVGLASCMGILVVTLNAVKGELAGAAAIFVMAAALGILVPVLKTLGSMSIGSLAKGILSIAAAFVVIGVAGLLLGPLAPVILALAGAFALIGVSVLAVGAGLAACALGLGALATAVAGGATAIVAGLTIIITGIIGLIPAVASKIGEAIIVFCGVIGDGATAIGSAVKKVLLALIDVFVECVPALVDGLLVLLSELLASLAEHTPEIVSSLFDFLIALIDGISERMPELIESGVNLIMSFFKGVVDALKGLDVGTLLQGILGMGIVAGLMFLLSLIAPLTPSAMLGVLGVGAVIAELALVLAAIGGLAQIPGLDWLVGEGGELLKSIGNALGGFVGGIIGGIAEGITASLPQIGTDMSEFMTNLGPFIEGAKLIDESLLENVNNLVKIVTAITSASLMESIASFITGESSMETFGTQLSGLATALTGFSSIVSGNMDEESITAAANAGTMLASLAESIPNTGGLVSFFTGDNDLSTFGSQLVPFGTAIKDFATEVADIDETAITAAANAGSMLASMAETIPNTGGLVSFFTGDNDLETFGTGIVAFGAAIKSFSTNVSGIDETAVAAATNAGSMLVSLAETVPNTGGLVSFFTGDNDLATFGTQIVAFGTAIKSFATEVSGIDVEAVTAAASAGTQLSNLANTLPETGGIWSIFSGDNSMEGFGKDLVSFGTAISNFSDEVKDISIEAVSTAVSAASSLTSLANNLETAGDEGDLSDVAKGAKGLGERLYDFYDEISDIDTEKISGVISAFTSLASASLPDLALLGTTLENAGKLAVSDFIKAFTDSDEKLTAAGKGMVVSLVKGVTDSKSAFGKTFKSIGTSGVTDARSTWSDYYKAGKYLVAGFALGIDADTWKAKAKAKAMATAAKEAAEKALGIESPSKVFYKIGAFTGQGFINALGDYEDKTFKAGGSIADSARLGFSKAIARVRDVIENGIDAQPTIRPVLDLSDIESGAGSISGMLGNPSLRTIGHVGAINSMMMNRQNGSNSDVISAINDLGKKLGNISSNTYQIGGITYDDGSTVSSAVESLIRAARVERRV